MSRDRTSRNGFLGPGKKRRSSAAGGFSAALDVVGGGGLVTQKTADSALLLFSPFDGVRLSFVDIGFDFSDGSGRTLKEPILLATSAD